MAAHSDSAAQVQILGTRSSHFNEHSSPQDPSTLCGFIDQPGVSKTSTSEASSPVLSAQAASGMRKISSSGSSTPLSHLSAPLLSSSSEPSECEPLVLEEEEEEVMGTVVVRREEERPPGQCRVSYLVKSTSLSDNLYEETYTAEPDGFSTNQGDWMLASAASGDDDGVGGGGGKRKRLGHGHEEGEEEEEEEITETTTGKRKLITAVTALSKNDLEGDNISIESAASSKDATTNGIGSGRGKRGGGITTMTDFDPRDTTKEARTELESLEVEFAALRKAAYYHKLAQYDHEAMLIKEGVHPAMCDWMKIIEERRRERTRIAAKKRDFQAEIVCKKYEEFRYSAICLYQTERASLRRKIIAETQRARRQLKEEFEESQRNQQLLPLISRTSEEPSSAVATGTSERGGGGDWDDPFNKRSLRQSNGGGFYAFAPPPLSICHHHHSKQKKDTVLPPVHELLLA